jgi:tRNA A-37 threonylcarbamoyl transferase component Bud32
MIPIAVADAGGGKTCNLTLGITNYIKAAELFKSFAPADRHRKFLLIKQAATLAGRMHAAGFAHQDLYLVHMFVRPEEDDKIYLIDLQRLIMREKLNRRWRIKDLGQLLFSARPEATEMDVKRFWKYYCDFAGKQLYRDKSLLAAIIAKADKITARDARKGRKK